METRTELILLQRTMVVVEGVARTMYPQINIWNVAQPVVEDYIKQNIGPRALLKDLVATAHVLTRFGPKLPQLAEAALRQQMSSSQEAPNKRESSALLYFTAGILVPVSLWGLFWLF
jgi:ubiquinone biosynthesis protein